MAGVVGQHVEIARTRVHDLDLEPGIYKVLRSPEKEITVSIPVLMDNGEVMGHMREHHGELLMEFVTIAEPETE